MSSIALTFEAFEEPEPGSCLAEPLRTALAALPRVVSLRGRGRADDATPIRSAPSHDHMPELVPTYEALCALAGGGDLEARFLAMFAPPSYLSGCSQAVWREPATATPILMRNYDYAPERLEGAILSTRWAGKRVIGVSDCAWGLLDGINEDGLAVSLAFGGRKVVGTGFGVPLVVRYLLQTCATTEAARAVLRRLPYHLAHTLTIVDAAGDTCTAYIAPDREVVLTDAPVATNHQGQVEWTEHARATFSLGARRCARRPRRRAARTRAGARRHAFLLRRSTRMATRGAWERSTRPRTTCGAGARRTSGRGSPGSRASRRSQPGVQSVSVESPAAA